MIRKAKKEDQVADIILLADECVFEQYDIKDFKECAQYLFENENNKFSYEHTYILEEDNIIKGLYSLYDSENETTLAKNQERLLEKRYEKKIDVVCTECYKDSYYLDTFAVKTEFQGQKNAHKMFEHIIKNKHNISLLAEEDNVRAISLYEKYGFKCVEKKDIFDGKYLVMLREV